MITQKLSLEKKTIDRCSVCDRIIVVYGFNDKKICKGCYYST